MLECMIIGDSIGNGIKSVMKDCVSITEIGINSENWYKKYHNRPMLDMQEYRYTVISLGSNDANEDSGGWMQRVRSKLKADRVIWILPSDTVKPQQRAIVERAAAKNGDIVLSIKQWVGPDGIHPPTFRAYEEIGKAIKDVKK